MKKITSFFSFLILLVFTHPAAAASQLGTVSSSAVGVRYYDNVLNAAAAGCVGDNATDNSACVAAMLAACSAQCHIHFGPGVFKINSAQSYTFPNDVARSLTVSGDGQGVTRLVFNNTNGLSINYSTAQRNSTHFREFTLEQAGADVGTGIALNGNSNSNYQVDPTTFDNVTLLAQQITKGGWNVGVLLNGISFVNFKGFHWNAPNSALGTGVWLQGNATTKTYAIAFQITNSIFMGGQYGIIYGTYAQGVETSNSQFINMETAVYASGLGQSQLAISNSQIDTQSSGVLIANQFGDLMISNNVLYTHAANISPIWLGGLVTGQIIGNSINNLESSSPTSQLGFGILVGATGNHLTITNNRIYNFAVAIGLLGGGSTVYGNTYYNNATNLSIAAGVLNNIGGASSVAAMTP